MVEQRPFKALVVGSSPTQPRAKAVDHGHFWAAIRRAQRTVQFRFHSMINPNGEDFTKDNPLPSPMQPGEAAFSGESTQSTPRFQEAREQVSTVASDTWEQTKQKAGVARERTEFFLRENPVPTVIGALAIGLAIGLAIRYSSESAEREAEVKSPLGDVNLGMLSLPFLWPFFKRVRRGYEDSAEVVKESVRGGVDRLKDVDVNSYVKPLRKKWRSWTK